MKPEYKAIAVTTTNGKIIQGILRQENATEVVLVDPAGKPQHIAKKDIEARRDIGSLMPEGLTAAMSDEQRRDLIRYLLELGRTEGLETSRHEVARFEASPEPLHPEHWPNRTQRVNRDRVYDFYTREAIHFQKQRPVPLLLPEWPDLDGGTYGHWGNQNDTVWKDGRWNQTDLGSLQCGVFRAGKLTIRAPSAFDSALTASLGARWRRASIQIRSRWKRCGRGASFASATAALVSWTASPPWYDARRAPGDEAGQTLRLSRLLSPRQTRGFCVPPRRRRHAGRSVGPGWALRP